MASNAADKRFWTWTFAELEVYFGVRRGDTSHFLKRKDFSPEILGVVNPKQLVETQNHPGFVPVVMGEDGKRPITKDVEKMLGSIPYAVMLRAVDALRKDAPEICSHFMAVQRRSPQSTMQAVADDYNIGIATLYRHIRHALDFVHWYLDMERAGWPEGAKVS